jgi:hypothetical protein
VYEYDRISQPSRDRWWNEKASRADWWRAKEARLQQRLTAIRNLNGSSLSRQTGWKDHN